MACPGFDRTGFCCFGVGGGGGGVLTSPPGLRGGDSSSRPWMGEGGRVLTGDWEAPVGLNHPTPTQKMVIPEYVPDPGTLIDPDLLS